MKKISKVSLDQAFNCNHRAGWAYTSHSNLFPTHSICLFTLLRVREEKLCWGSLIIHCELQQRPLCWYRDWLWMETDDPTHLWEEEGIFQAWWEAIRLLTILLGREQGCLEKQLLLSHWTHSTCRSTQQRSSAEWQWWSMLHTVPAHSGPATQHSKMTSSDKNSNSCLPFVIHRSWGS